MIKPSTIIILGILALGLVIAVYGIQGDRPQYTSTNAVGKPLLEKFEQAKVSAIELKKGAVTIKLEKKDNNWLMPTHKDRLAKFDRVDQLLSGVGTAAIEGTRSGAPDLFALDDKGRTELVLTTDTGKQTVYLGKSPDYSKSFVQTQANGPILEVDHGLDTDAGIRIEKDERVLDPSYFYDLKIFSFGADELIDIAITKGAETTRVQKVVKGKGPLQPKQEPAKDDPPAAWTITSPETKEVDDGAMNALTSTLANLNAKSYADAVAEKDRGLDAPNAVVKFVLKDGREMALTFGKIEGDDIIMAVAGRADAFKIYKYVYDSLTKDLSKKEGAAANPAPGEVKIPGIPSNLLQPPKTEPVKPPEKKEAAPTPPPPDKKEAVPQPPPPKIEKEEKPAVPPALVKQPNPEAKVEPKK